MPPGDRSRTWFPEMIEQLGGAREHRSSLDAKGCSAVASGPRAALGANERRTAKGDRQISFFQMAQGLTVEVELLDFLFEIFFHWNALFLERMGPGPIGDCVRVSSKA